MIRVAFGTVPKDGGTFTFYRNMRPALLRHNIDLRCVSVGPEQAALTEAAFVDDGCVQLAADVRDLKRQAQAFVAWCEREDIDVVFGVNSPGILCALPHLPERIRVMARCANGFDEGYRLTLMGRDRLARIVALVPRLREDLIAGYGVAPDLITLIPNGASVDRFAAAAARARGQDEVLSLGFLGRLEHNQKGVLHIPDILRGLDRAAVAYRLRIAGKGRHEPELRAALAEHIADGRVTFVGSLGPDEIPGFLAETDVFLFTSHFEGCPNALLEAMMAGTVPVSWRLPGITDFLIEDGQTGFLAETGDATGFAAHIARLASDRALVNATSCAGSAAARDGFSVERCVDRYVDLFGEIADAPAPAWQPRPWSAFETPAMFKSNPIARLIPANQKQAIRALRSKVLGRGVAPAQVNGTAPRARRIHQIINSASLNLGGAERLARSLHVELREAGVDARLVSLQDCDLDGLDHAVSLGLKSPYDPRALVRLARYAREIAPGDIVHAHLFPTNACLAVLARAGQIKAPLLFTEHNSSNRRRSHPVGAMIDARVYAAFDTVICISNGVEKTLLDARPMLAGRTQVIETGCRLAFAAPVDRRGRNGPLKIVSVGRLAPQKNYQMALRALAQLKRCDFVYEIAGTGPEQGQLAALADELTLTKNVRFAGHLSDVPAFLKDADIFLMPSAWEGFGLAAVEAMNASLPVIASDVDGLRDVVGTDGSAALLVDPTSVTSISAAIEKVCGSPDLRRTLGQAGFERSRAFDLGRWVEAHIRLYETVGDHHARAA